MTAKGRWRVCGRRRGAALLLLPLILSRRESSSSEAYLLRFRFQHRRASGRLVFLPAAPLQDAAASPGATATAAASPGAASSTSSGAAAGIEGLASAKDFARRSAVHAALRELRWQIPRLLEVPLTDDTCSKVYAEDTTLVVAAAATATSSSEKSDESSSKGGEDEDGKQQEEEIELATSRKELVSISTSLVLAATASARAASLLSAFVSTTPGGESPARAVAPRVDCKLILDPNLQSVQVEWETNLLPNSTSTGTAAAAVDGLGFVRGVSELVLDPESGKIRKHRLLAVNWNGRDQDARSIGRALSALRRSVLGLQDAPLFKTLLGGGGSGSGDGSSATSSPWSILDQVREEWLEQFTSSSSADGGDAALLAPVYVRMGNSTTLLADDDGAGNSTEGGGGVMLIDEYCDRLAALQQSPENKTGRQSPLLLPPLPGSSRWDAYAAAHRTIENFVRRFVPILSETGDPTQIRSLFAPQVRLLTLDGSLLLQGSSRVANFYNSLKAMRTRTFGSWTLRKASVLKWSEDSAVVRIDFVANVSVPGTSTVSIRGTDDYVLSYRPGDYLGSVENPPTTEAVIEEIRQTALSVGDSATPVQDGLLLVQSLATAAETGRISDDSVWIDLLQRVGKPSPLKPRQATEPGLREVQGEKRVTRRVITRSDEAAATVYRIMDSLHREIPAIVDAASTVYLPPAQEYMVENVRLLGYLGEDLLRGRATYDRTFSLSVASLKAALRTERLVSEREPSVKVELTADRNVRVALTFHLKFKPVPDFRPPFDGGDSIGIAGLPFRLGIVSEYMLDADTGLIVRHQLKETRINGQLTPADVVSRWIQRLVGRGKGGASSSDEQVPDDRAAESLLRGLMDTVNWVRSLSDGKDVP